MYGVGSVGVLCVAPSRTTKPSHDNTVVLPRSEVRHKLSIFSERAHPRDETSTLCSHLDKIISRIMDQVLTTIPGLQSQVGVAEDAQSDFPIDYDIDRLE